MSTFPICVWGKVLADTSAHEIQISQIGLAGNFVYSTAQAAFGIYPWEGLHIAVPHQRESLEYAAIRCKHQSSCWVSLTTLPQTIQARLSGHASKPQELIESAWIFVQPVSNCRKIQGLANLDSAIWVF